MKILFLGLGKTVTSASLPQSWPDTYVTKNFFGHDVITFGYTEGVDIKCKPEDTLEDILKKLPYGWFPDVCICTHIDWVFIPKGMEEAPFPIINITADWDYRIPIARTCAELFDINITLGKDSTAAMTSLGADYAYPFHYFGVLSEHIYPDIDDIENREYDISFTGSINDVSHHDRSKWLLRICELSEKYNVYINFPGSSIEEYQAIQRKSKIVFTFHRRGELQLRFTDAAVQGALMLDSGKETAKYFVPEEEYASFDDENFEIQIEKYLNDEPLRKRVVKKCFDKTVSGFESRKRYKELIEFIEEKVEEIPTGKRKYCFLTKDEKLFRTAEIFYYNYYETFIPKHVSFLYRSFELLAEAKEINPSPRIMTSLAVVGSSVGFNSGDGFEDNTHFKDAIKLLNKVIEEYPFYSMAHFNLGFLYYSTNEHEKAEVCFKKAIETLEDKLENFDPWCLYHFEHHSKSQDYKKILNDCLILIAGENKLRGLKSASNLYISTCWYFIGNILLHRGKLYEAVDCWKKSLSKNAERGRIAAHLAELMDVLGDKDGSCKMYEKALSLLPLDIELRCDFIKFLYRNRKIEQCFKVCKSTINICKSIRMYRLKLKPLQKIMEYIETSLKKEDEVFEGLDILEEEYFNNTIDYIKSAYSKNSSDCRILLRAASLFINGNCHDKAIKIIENVYKTSSGDEKIEIYKSLVSLYRLQIEKNRVSLKKFRDKHKLILSENQNIQWKEFFKDMSLNNKMFPDKNNGKQRKNPKVSVLVRTFNRPRLLAECLESIASQNLSDFEVVVVNDGGEAVENVINRFRKKIRITLVNHSGNFGRSAAWNSGIKLARGKYISFLDDDDVYYPDHLETLLLELEKGESKAAYSQCYFVKERRVNGTKEIISKDVYKTEDFIPELFLMKNYVPILALMVEKECLEDAGLFDESFDVHEDWDLLIRLSQQTKFSYIRKTTAEYRIRDDNSNSCTAERKEYFYSLLNIYKKYYYISRNNQNILDVQRNNIELLKAETGL